MAGGGRGRTGKGKRKQEVQPKRKTRQDYLREIYEYVREIKESDLDKMKEKFDSCLEEGEDGKFSLKIDDAQEFFKGLLDVEADIPTMEIDPFSCFGDAPSSLFHCLSGLYDRSGLWALAEFPVVVAFFQSVVLPVLLPMAVGFVSGYLGKKYVYDYWPELPRYGLTIYRIPGGSSAPHTDRFLDAKVHFLSSLDNTTLGGLDYGN